MTLIFIASLFPPLFLLWKVYQYDSIEKEPIGLLVTIFIFGMIATLPAGILETIGQVALLRIPLARFLPTFAVLRVSNALFYFLVVGGAEELVKYYAMKLPTWRNPEFNYVFDGVVYGVTSSIGFAALENLLYVVDSGIVTAGVRAWTAIPLHCITGIFMGHFYGIAKAADLWNDIRIRNRMLRRSVLVPMLIHGAYDFIATDESEILTIAFLLYIIVLDIVALRALKRYASSDTSFY